MNEWHTYFKALFAQCSFDGITAVLIDRIILSFDAQFFSKLKNLKALHASEIGQYRDFFGDWTMQQNVALDANFDQVLTPYQIVDFMAESVVENLLAKHPDKQPVFIDPCCGTGRFMLGITKACKQRSIEKYEIYCVDIDERMVAIAVTNALLHNIDCYIVHGDVLDFSIFKAYQIKNGKLWESYNYAYLKQVLYCHLHNGDNDKVQDKVQSGLF